MSERTITLSSEIVERLEQLAEQEGRDLNALFDELLNYYVSPIQESNWALNLADNMENADIDWQDMPDLSSNSRASFENEAYQTWLKSQEQAQDE